MSLKLVKPGIRGKFWYARGTVAGKRVEASTRTTDKATAEINKLEIERKIRAATSDNLTTYGEVAERYILDHPGLSKWEALVHRRLQGELYETSLSSIGQSTVSAMAGLFYPKAKGSTKNRWIVRPISAVMHYGKRLKVCSSVDLNKFPEDKPRPRAVTKDIAGIIINAAGQQKDKPLLKRLICLWMFKHGNRISEIISAEGKNINFKENTFLIYMAKGRTWQEFVLDSEVKTALRKVFPKGLPEGRIFPWTHRWSVYKWLRPMCRGLGVEFTPHAARHSLGTWFASAGAGLRATMSRLGHKDVKSSMRYQNEDIDIIRQTNKKIGNIGGKKRGRKNKSKKNK